VLKTCASNPSILSVHVALTVHSTALSSKADIYNVCKEGIENSGGFRNSPSLPFYIRTLMALGEGERGMKEFGERVKGDLMVLNGDFMDRGKVEGMRMKLGGGGGDITFDVDSAVMGIDGSGVGEDDGSVKGVVWEGYSKDWREGVERIRGIYECAKGCGWMGEGGDRW